MDEARLQLFINNYGGVVEATDKFKKKLLNFDACLLPPCQRELHQHILRTSYIGHLWSNSTESIPCGLDICEYGWRLEENCFTFKWFEGEELPECVGDILEIDENEGITTLSYTLTHNITYTLYSLTDLNDEENEDESECENDSSSDDNGDSSDEDENINDYDENIEYEDGADDDESAEDEVGMDSQNEESGE